uniref:Uncharacterized protein n=1 Tax=Coccidioides posadasii RMSCC 3488 TaxID=454284 RepID=A0A0J6IH79_COCPO|nr:hypothetical protein CPAG_07479 [Coccidioides posadasii RMSCC 3488]
MSLSLALEYPWLLDPPFQYPYIPGYSRDTFPSLITKSPFGIQPLRRVVVLYPLTDSRCYLYMVTQNHFKREPGNPWFRGLMRSSYSASIFSRLYAATSPSSRCQIFQTCYT